MTTFAALAAAITFFVFVWYGLRWLIGKGRRRFFLKRMGLAFVAFFAAALVFGFFNNQDARLAGFADAAEREAAKTAGITDPAVWAAQKADILKKKAEAEQAAAAGAAAADAQKAKDEAAAEERKKSEEAAAAATAEQEQKAADEKAAADKLAKEAACRADIKCWGERAIDSIEINLVCREGIERHAKNDFQWTDGMMTPRYSKYRWKDKERGIVTLLGDEIKFQNGFGAWAIMTYACDADPATNTVSDINVAQGQL